MTITNGGLGYSTAPTVAFSAPRTGLAAAGTTTVLDQVTSVRITNRGRGYTSAPAVSLTGGGGSGAAATATVKRRGNTQADNLYWARQTLYGKQLLVQIVDE